LVLSKRDSILQGFELILTENGNYSTIKRKTFLFYFRMLDHSSGATNYLRYLFEKIPFAENEDDYRKLLPMNLGSEQLALPEQPTGV